RRRPVRERCCPAPPTRMQMPMTLRDEATEEQTKADYRRTIDRLQRQLAKEKNRTEEIIGAVHRAVSEAAAALDFPPVPPAKSDRRTKGEETAVLMLSDWQL